MNRTKGIIGFLLAALLICVSSALAETVDRDEALAIAENWIELIVYYQGDWGGSPAAHVTEIREFMQEDRLLGYFCRVEPQGYIVVSLLKGLAPVKSFSATSNLDPDATKGPTDLIKYKMTLMQQMVEEKLGPVGGVKADDLKNITEIDYFPAWESLTLDKAIFTERITADADKANYQARDVMLTTSWRQGDPYNLYCPASPPGLCADGRCPVGCVATASAQILRHWSWPPSDIHFSGWWYLMADRIDTLSAQQEIDAIAGLGAQIGTYVGMTYCSDAECKSSATTSDMEGVFENIYGMDIACTRLARADFTGQEWWDMIVAQLNVNRPMLYRIVGHAIVCDGWGGFGDPPVAMYHMNYGWNDAHNSWYVVDALYYPAGGSLSDEYLLANIFPQSMVGLPMSGIYGRNPSFPYRYFTTDCPASAATTFEAGQALQFLPNIVVSGLNDYVQFVSTSELNTQLFSNGDQRRGAMLKGGTIKVNPGGGIKFFRLIGL